jgi:hypothetical protein
MEAFSGKLLLVLCCFIVASSAALTRCNSVELPEAPRYIAIFRSAKHANAANMHDCVTFVTSPDEYWCFTSKKLLFENNEGLVKITLNGISRTAGCEKEAPWNLLRVRQRQPNLHRDYAWPNYSQPKIYVVDTYIDTDHPDFEKRASRGFTTGDLGTMQAHGTHVAGTCASKTYGAAKTARIVSVQVLNNEGYGSWSDIIKGLSYISHEERRANRTNIVNMSISGQSSDIMNMAVESLVKQGLVVVVAAGNDGRNACQNSPASSPIAITVGSSGITDNYSRFSNHGKCVNIAAPGEAIKSTIPNGRSGIMSGTSMASPLVSGVIALYLSLPGMSQATPASVHTELMKYASRGFMSNLPSETANLLAYFHHESVCVDEDSEKPKSVFGQLFMSIRSYIGEGAY